MIRLRPLRPREQRNLRHWVMELVVVVVGVLLALWAQEWVEARREEQRLGEVEAAMRDELRYNYLVWALHETDHECHRLFSKRMRALLGSSGATWPGYQSQFVEERGEGEQAPVGIVGVMTDQIKMDAWRNAQDSGLLERMPIDRLDQYRRLYGRMEFLDAAIKNIETARNNLSGLIDPIPLSSETRADALRDLVLFNNGLLRRTMMRDDFLTDLPAMGIGSTPALEADFKQIQENVREQQKSPGFECARIPENELPPEETL